MVSVNTVISFFHGFTVHHDVIKVFYVAAATPPKQPQRSILTDYFNNYNFIKTQIIRSLMMVIKPKYVGAVLM
jgi:hypothetical protein